MHRKAMPSGFQPIRRDRLLQEEAPDAYKSRGKLPEPTVCPQCRAVFRKGRWRWAEAPQNAHAVTCPACHRLNDKYPAGFVSLSGPFFSAHRDEIMRLVRNQEQRERQGHPLKRILGIEEQDAAALVTTSDIHLARGIGDALHHAYQGELEFHHKADENLLRVHWAR
ncbi:MAG: ATPase [Rhodocyclales bacterium RIFCSPLOWO2_02_FULL_63_24]|nr:MAG: ATPase [Rhodocyclales bacterium GWA2_65_19]OHC71024.1 MAG: ATPase [Rhodocyclales bacterium RIFCSPLOWO2_02_FULL_63_24]